MHLRQEALLGQMATFRIHSEFLKWEGWTILEVALWPPHAKSWLIGKDSDAGRDWGQEEKGTTEDEMAVLHHWLDRRESEWTPGVGDGQAGLASCDSWGRKESDTTEQLNWTELNQPYWASLVALVVKNPPAMQETWVESLGWEEPLKEEIAAHSRILA